MKTKLYCLLVPIIILTSISNIWSQDIVNFVNKGAGDTTGILIDGALNGTFVNDKTYSTVLNAINIGNYNSSKGKNTNEIMAFSKDRPMEIYSPAPWTAGVNNVTVTFSNKILIPVTIWVLYGSFDTVCVKLTSNLLTASTSFISEKTGIDFSTVTFKDATSNPKASNYYTFPGSSTNTTTIKNDIGFINGQLNIYVTQQLILSGDGMPYTNSGIAYSSAGIIMVGSKSGPTLLLHEIGHTFSLKHITDIPDFDWTNSLTQQIRPWSTLFTEGQVLRMHLGTYSVINTIYKARPGKIQRNCPPGAGSDNYCPALNKRIWADGTFPAN